MSPAVCHKTHIAIASAKIYSYGMVTRTKDSEYLFSYHWIATGRPLSLCLPIAPGIYECNDTKGDTGLCKSQCFCTRQNSGRLSD